MWVATKQSMGKHENEHGQADIPPPVTFPASAPLAPVMGKHEEHKRDGAAPTVTFPSTGLAPAWAACSSRNSKRRWPSTGNPNTAACAIVGGVALVVIVGLLIVRIHRNGSTKASGGDMSS